ncbi:MAG: GPW/gp25 family protein [Phototrophicaceae bacterium]
MDNQFLGKGWGFPIALDNDGTIKVSHYQEAVRQSIWMILGTAPGERVMRPDFGCGIHEMVYGLNTPRTQNDITDEVYRALVLWEPRITVIEVTVAEVPNEINHLTIEIEYVLRADNSRYNLVYPFYLG